jgi:hypothetical protein
MLTLLAALGTTIAAVLSALSIGEKAKNLSEGQSKRRLAQLLNLTYLRLNDCIVTGEQILALLQAFAEDKASLSFGKECFIQHDGAYLHDLVSRQREQLLSLADCIVNLSNVIQAVDANLYLQLRQFVAFKGVGLDWLAALFDRGMIPLDGLRYDEVEGLALKSEFMLPEDETVPPANLGTAADLASPTPTFFHWYDDVSVISNRMHGHSITIDELVEHHPEDFKNAVKAAGLDRLKSMLGQNNLWNHLDEAKTGAGRLKEFIEKNFSVVELLLDVGSEDLKKTSEW